MILEARIIGHAFRDPRFYYCYYSWPEGCSTRLTDRRLHCSGRTTSEGKSLLWTTKPTSTQTRAERSPNYMATGCPSPRIAFARFLAMPGVILLAIITSREVLMGPKTLAG